MSERAYFVHATSCVDEPCTIGEGTKIWHFSHVMADSVIGRDCTIGQNVFVASGVKIGDHCKIQNNVSVYAGVVLEDHVFCGPSMVFTNVVNPRSEIVRRDEYKATRVKRGASIGANATILCGVTLGAYSFVGAGAVVTHDVPDFALVTGNPARRTGWMCRCGIKLEPEGEKPRCGACGTAYALHVDALRLV
jgi:UDP-2-acetamido-3-amino-2,3-dideoxy-glucuronate N-acetyltransferase